MPVIIIAIYFSGWFREYIFLQINTAETIDTKIIQESNTIETVLRLLSINKTTPRMIYKKFAIKPTIKDVFVFIILIPLFYIDYILSHNLIKY